MTQASLGTNPVKSVGSLVFMVFQMHSHNSDQTVDMQAHLQKLHKISQIYIQENLKKNLK